MELPREVSPHPDFHIVSPRVNLGPSLWWASPLIVVGAWDSDLASAPLQNWFQNTLHRSFLFCVEANVCIVRIDATELDLHPSSRRSSASASGLH